MLSHSRAKNLIRRQCGTDLRLFIAQPDTS